MGSELIVGVSRFNFRLNYQNGKIIDKEIILQGDIGRIRDFEIDEAGDFYVVVDDNGWG